jgi:FtsP/CotA-like multicopper oxidase with cupredoxin domain
MSENAIIKAADDADVTPSRRRFVASALAAALGLSLADVLGPEELEASPQSPPVCPSIGQQFQPFVPVAEFVSHKTSNPADPNLSVNMTVKTAWKYVTTIAGQGLQCNPMKLRYYEGQYAKKSPLAYPPNPKLAIWPANPSLPGPGPTFRVRIGDRIQVHLLNAIDPAFLPATTADEMACDVITGNDPASGGNIAYYPQTETMPSCLHGDNTTNMHYHGTHVTPDGTGDNVMVDVYPKGHTPANPPPPPQKVWSEFVNDFRIPLPPPAANPLNPSKNMLMGQAPGTHWYHAHKHGSVALQLLNGMSGAFIIEGEFDDQLEKLMPGLRATEKVMVIQQIGDKIGIQLKQDSVLPGVPLNTCATGDPRTLVNGQLQPTITMQPGEIQRWRFVNATMQQVSYLTYSFAGKDPANPGYAPVIRQIAYEGVQLAPERYNDPMFGLSQQFTVAPGNRIDILVQAPATPGDSLLNFKLVHGKPPAGCQPTTLGAPYLLQLSVKGTAVQMSFPTAANYPAIPDWLQWDKVPATPTPPRTLQFNWAAGDKTNRPAIDGKVFDGATTRQTFALGTSTELTLENFWASSIHPYHIHVNPFQVMEIFDPNNPAETQHIVMQEPYIWRDTIAIPAANDHGKDANGQVNGQPGPPTTNGWVKIRSKFVDFTGTFVLHCHILDHEDRGMMQEVTVYEIPPMKPHH